MLILIPILIASYTYKKGYLYYFMTPNSKIPCPSPVGIVHVLT